MTDQFIMLPREGLHATSGPALDILTSLPRVSTLPGVHATIKEMSSQPSVVVLDTIAENGPKLVTMDEQTARSINETNAPIRMVRVVEYGRPDPRPRPVGANITAAPVGGTNVTCVDAVTSQPIPNVHVVGFTNFIARQGDEGITDATGRVMLHLAGATIERLYCYAPAGYWGSFRKQLKTGSSIQISHEPVTLSYVDCVRHYYGNSRFNVQTGVKVGVIDTGSGPHHDLAILGGANTVTGENPLDFFDGDIHGTHVSGLIGSNGTPPIGLRGVAPGVGLWIGRVFGANAGGATNYAILKAMILAANNTCDIINLSLGGGPRDPIVEEAIDDARNQGMLVVIAAGNDGRQAVNYPAAYKGATAVSAMGREGTFPKGSLEEGEVQRPPSSKDQAEFLAGFSNCGPDIAVTGLGVGTLSTLPGNLHGPLSGTSMAAPVIAGATASLLSNDLVIFGMPRNRARSEAIERLLLSNCVKRGFGMIYEGFGLPDPAIV